MALFSRFFKIINILLRIFPHFLQVKTIIMHELSKVEGQLLTLSLDRGDLQANFGFSLRGGVEHGVGHFVSSVDTGSVAESQGNIIYVYDKI